MDFTTPAALRPFPRDAELKTQDPVTVRCVPDDSPVDMAEDPISPNPYRPERVDYMGFDTTNLAKPVSQPQTVGGESDIAAAAGQPGAHHAREQSDDSTFGAGLIHNERRDWPEDKERLLMAPFDYYEKNPGKDIRSQLIAAFNVWLDVPAQSLKTITRVVGMLHTSSLLIDDVEDDSQLRRGVPVAHNIFGTAQTINSANYVYFHALQEVQKLRNPQCIHIFTEELLNLHRGQGMDLWWRDTLTCPTEAEYLEMVDNKTGGLFRLAVKLMQAESSSAKNCVPLVNAVGLLFQILDDYQNLSSTIYEANKGLAEDLTEGKFSFPVIHCVRSNPRDRVLLNIIRQKPKDEEVKRYAIKHMERAGSFQYTRERLRELTAEAYVLVDEMEAGDAGSGEPIRRILRKISLDESS